MGVNCQNRREEQREHDLADSAKRDDHYDRRGHDPDEAPGPDAEPGGRPRARRRRLGIGGLQTRPFILHPEHLHVPEGPILGAASVHGILTGWRKEGRSRAAAARRT